MAKVASRWPVTVEVWVAFQVRLCGICGGQKRWERFSSEYT